MLFYAVISSLVGPLVGGYFGYPGHGYVGGTAVSLLLWFLAGSKMI
jgi:hypothetical protein